MVMVGADLEGLELRTLAHYLHRFDEGAFADVVVNGDIHQQNADRVGCSRRDVKTLTYAFIYGAGDQKLGHSLHPELSDAQKKQLGQELRRKFLDAIPGLEPLINAVKEKVRSSGRLRGLDGRPIFCRAEHASLNYLLQSAGAIVSKRWVVVGQELLDGAGLTYNVDYTRCAYVHDEVQLSVMPSEAERVAKLLEEAAPKAGQYYRFRVPITASADQGQELGGYTLMEDDILFNFQVDSSALKILVKALDKYIEKWPGGHPAEQEKLKKMQSELHKAYLELTFLE